MPSYNPERYTMFSEFNFRRYSLLAACISGNHNGVATDP